MNTEKDFFISYNKHDRGWAEWIAYQLEAKDHTVVIQAWDWGPGNNFVVEMQRAASTCRRTLLVLSPHFLKSLYVQPEWAQAFAKDPTGEKRLLIPVRVQECELKGFFGPLVYIDFLEAAPLAQTERRDHLVRLLLDGVAVERRKPTSEPPLPQFSQETVAPPENLHTAYGQRFVDNLFLLESKWLSGGPTVSILQGFPGTGKTLLASRLRASNFAVVAPITVELDSSDPGGDVLISISAELKAHGIEEFELEFDKEDSANLYDALFRALRKHRLLLIIDEFQRLFDEKQSVPPLEWQVLLERLNDSPQTQGRLLLISNRLCATARWNEKCLAIDVTGLEEQEASTMLRELLDSKGITARVPDNRLKELAQRLGGNPRAIKTLVGCLLYDTLEELMPYLPLNGETGDVNLAADLLAKFERELIARTLPRLDNDLSKLLHRLCVHRQLIQRSFYESTAFPNWKERRRQLIDRYLLEAQPLGDSLHPLAREVCVSRLRQNTLEWKSSHSEAADFHKKGFSFGKLVASRKVASSFIEVRHHLFESGRISELHAVSVQMSKFVVSRIKSQTLTKVPTTVESLEEHIALLSALPDGLRTKPLAYHLALCLRQRGMESDLESALALARTAVGPNSYYAHWLLLLELEYEIHGADAMVASMGRAVKSLGNGANCFAVYHSCANMLDKDGKLERAIELIEKAATTPGMACVASLVSLGSRLLQRAGQPKRAIDLLTSVASNPKLANPGVVFDHWASMLTAEEKYEEAVDLLDRAIATPGITKLKHLYVHRAECYQRLGRREEALSSLAVGMRDSRVLDPSPIYCKCAEMLIDEGRTDSAIQALQSGLTESRVRNPVAIYHSLATLLEKTGRSEEAVRILRSALANPRLQREPSLFLACSDVLFHQRKLEDAVRVLDEGIRKANHHSLNLLMQKKAGILDRLGRTKEAIRDLEHAIASNSDHRNLECLYLDCARLHVKQGELAPAIQVLQKGTEAPAVANKSILYQLLAELLVKQGDSSTAVTILRKALALPGLTGRVNLYQTCARVLVKEGFAKEAVELLEQAFAGPKIGNVGSLYHLCATIMISYGQHAKAVRLLLKGIEECPKDQGLKHLHEKLTS